MDWLKWLVIGGSAAAVAYLALVPLLFLLWQSVRPPAGSDVTWTLGHFRDLYATHGAARLVGDSLRFAAGSSLVAFSIGALLAWMNERTNVPFKRLFFALSIVPLVVPGVLFVVAWILLGSPRIGVVNVALRSLLATDAVYVDVYSMAGMAFVDGLHYAPLAFLMMSAAFRAMDPALEEAALMSGASVAAIARRITLPVIRPVAAATLLILFVRALESFEVPALLGLPAGIRVFTSAIYAAVHHYPSEIGLASAYGVTLLAVTLAGVWLQSRVARHGDRHATVTGRGYRPRLIDLGRWRPVAAALALVYFSLIVGLPLLVLLWSSVQKFYAAPSLDALRALTLDPYRSVLGYAGIGRAAFNSIALAAGAATVIMLVTSVIAWVVARTSGRGSRALDAMASAPIVVPGIVLGLALMVFYVEVDIGIYGTSWILFIAYVTRFLPYGVRYNAASMLSIHRELEEAAAASGASWWTTFRRIVLPLLRPGFIAGWIYIALVCVRELSSSILLYGPGSRVLSIVIWELWENGQYVELSALGVLMIAALLALATVAQRIGGRTGVPT